jgi:hypothetical protein
MGQHIAQSMQDSIGRVLTKIANFLPGIVAFILVVLIFVAIAAGLAWCVQRVLTAVRFDTRFEQHENLTEWTHSPSYFLSRLIFWAVLLLGFLLGISAFEAGSYDTGVAAYIFPFVPRLVGALVLLFVGNLVARVLSRSVLISSVNMNLQYARLLSAGVKWLVLVLTAAMVLDHLAIGGRIVDLAFGILFGGIVFALALAVGLGSRDLVTRSLEREVTLARPTPVPAKDEKIHHF